MDNGLKQLTDHPQLFIMLAPVGAPLAIAAAQRIAKSATDGDEEAIPYRLPPDRTEIRSYLWRC